MKNQNDYCKVLATKVTINSYNQMMMIAEHFGMPTYKLLQFVVDAYLKYFSGYVNISEESKTIISNFSGIKLAKNGFTLCDPSKRKIAKRKVQSCIILFEQEGIEHPQALLLKNGKDGILSNMNSDTILITLLSAIAPELIDILKVIKEDKKLLSLTDSMKYAIKYERNNDYDISQDIAELFSDNDRSEYGIKPHDGAPFKRRNRRNMEILFHDTPA